MLRCIVLQLGPAAFELASTCRPLMEAVLAVQQQGGIRRSKLSEALVSRGHSARAANQFELRTRSDRVQGQAYLALQRQDWITDAHLRGCRHALQKWRRTWIYSRKILVLQEHCGRWARQRRAERDRAARTLQEACRARAVGSPESGSSMTLESVPIFVKGLTEGGSFVILVRLGSTAGNLKASIERVRGWPSELLRIIFEGKLLGDTDDLGARGISRDSTVHLVTGLRAGARSEQSSAREADPKAGRRSASGSGASIWKGSRVRQAAAQRGHTAARASPVHQAGSDVTPPPSEAAVSPPHLQYPRLQVRTATPSPADSPVRSLALTLMAARLDAPVAKRLLLTHEREFTQIDQPLIVVSIRTPYAVTLRQVVDVQDTVQLIKAKVEEALGLSTSRQRLTLRAQSTRALSDSARVGELQEDTLDLYDIRGDDLRNCGVRLTIVTVGGVQLRLTARLQEPIRSIKCRLQKHMWHLASEQCLFYKGMQLSDHSDLGDHGINEHALLLFRLRGSDEAELQGIQQGISERMQTDAEEGTQTRAAEMLLPIFIKGPTHGRSFSVEVPPDATIGAIKDAIERVLGIPVQAQRLIFGSRHVNDMDLLVSHGIGRDSTLHLATTLQGGMEIPENHCICGQRLHATARCAGCRRRMHAQAEVACCRCHPPKEGSHGAPPGAARGSDRGRSPPRDRSRRPPGERNVQQRLHQLHNSLQFKGAPMPGAGQLPLPQRRRRMEPKGSELADEERRARAAGVGSKRDHQHWFAECMRLALVASASAHNAAEDSQRPPKKRARPATYMVLDDSETSATSDSEGGADPPAGVLPRIYSPLPELLEPPLVQVVAQAEGAARISLGVSEADTSDSEEDHVGAAAEATSEGEAPLPPGSNGGNAHVAGTPSSDLEDPPPGRSLRPAGSGFWCAHPPSTHVPTGADSTNIRAEGLSAGEAVLGEC